MIKFLRKAGKEALRGVALLRLDFNTEDEWRMRATIPTIQLLLRRANKVVMVSHRGRPHAVEKWLSLRRDARALAAMIKQPVRFIPHFRFAEIKRIIARAPKGSIFLLENIRFLKEEMTPQPELARQLASLADYYVNDAFAVSHRREDSITRVERFLPSYGGLNLEQELKVLSGILARPKKPFVVILGGGKAEDKLGVIESLKNKADAFLLGGAAANTFLFLRGVNVGKSRRDENARDLAHFEKIAKMKKVIVPVDWNEKNGAIVDIGLRTVAVFQKHIASARTILWSGPMGVIEKKPFEKGTRAVARAVAANRMALSIVGGGETVMFVKKHHLDQKFSFISTGGGAMLEFLSGRKLPGIEVLRQLSKK